MKKLINLFALVMLVSVNALTPFTYAQEIPENDTGIVENEWEKYLDSQQNEEVGDSSQDVQEDDVIQTLETEEYETVSQLLETDIQEGTNSEEINEELDEETDDELIQPQNLNIVEIDLNNPIHLYRDWELTWSYTWLSQAINEAESGDVIKLIDDISVSTASVISWKSLTIDGDNHTITRIANIRTITVNEGSSLKLVDITITDNAVNFAPNRYNSLLTAKSNIPLCLWWVNETRNESWDVTASVCATENVDTAKTNPQIYSVWDIYGDNLTISNSLNSNWSAAIIVEKWWIEMVNSSFIHNWASGWWRGWAIRVWPNTATNIVDESPITKISFSWCVFESNYSNAYWWALAFHYAPEIITIDNCIFSGNTASANWWAIHIPNIWTNPMWSLPKLPDWSNFPVWTMYVTNSDFYSNWCGNDGSAIENDDKNLEIDTSNFEHNYWTQPGNTSVWVISCQVWWANRRIGRWLIRRNYEINNSLFRDSNTVVLWDHWRFWSFIVDSCLFEDQKYVLLSWHWVWEVKNSTIRNSNPFENCGKKWWYYVRDFNLNPESDYIKESLVNPNGSIFKLDNNVYSNGCQTNPYLQVRIDNSYTWIGYLNIGNEENTMVLMHRLYYDSTNIQWTDEIYYWAIIDDWNYAYIKKNNIYDFDEFNAELWKWTTWYQLESWKAMLFYLDSGYTQLWSGSISTTTNLYKKETDIYNITYEWMDRINFEWITHTYKFINLDHTQYLTELTPYTLNTPSRNWYRFEWWFLDSEYTIPVTSIESWSTWDIILYAKREKLWSSWNWWGSWGWWGSSDKPNTPKEDKTPTDNPENKPENKSDNDNQSNTTEESNDEKDSEVNEQVSEKSTDWQNDSTESSNPSTESSVTSQEFIKAYEFAKDNWITTMPTIQKAQMDSKLTRIQMAKMLSQYAVNILWKEPDISKWTMRFKDVTDKMNKDYDNGVILSYQLWIMWQNMPNNKFRPDDEVTRAEFVTALSRMLYNTSDWEYKSTSKYYTHHMEKLVKEWIITKDNPAMKEIRGYVMIMLMRSAEK